MLRRRFLVLNDRPCESIAIGSEARPFFKLAADLSSIFKERAEIAGRVLESSCRSSLRASINPFIRSRCLYLPRRVRMRCLALDFLLSVFTLPFLNADHNGLNRPCTSSLLRSARAFLRVSRSFTSKPNNRALSPDPSTFTIINCPKSPPYVSA